MTLPDVTAVVLAAGQSRRMGRDKLLLPWNDTTVLGQTLRIVAETAVARALVVTGHRAKAIAAIAAAHGVPAVHNPNYAAGEMLSSLQTAVRYLQTAHPDTMAALVVLADQPMIPPSAINQLLAAFQPGRADLVAPTYNGRRGNPVLIGRPYFGELLALPPEAMPRALLTRHAAAVRLVEVETAAVLEDLDTPEQYERRHNEVME